MDNGLRLSFVVPMWNRQDCTDHMIEQLNNQSLDTFDLVVVDDGSDIAYSEPLFNKGNVSLIKHSTNLGVSSAWNSGTIAAICSGADLVCIINNDIKIDNNLAERLIFYHGEGFDAVCPSMRPTANPDLRATWDFSNSYRYGMHGFCFSVTSQVLTHRYREDSWYFDTNFSGADWEDIDFQVWFQSKEYVSIIIKDALFWDNQSASSSIQNKPNKEYCLAKWGGYNEIQKMRNNLFDEEGLFI